MKYFTLALTFFNLFSPVDAGTCVAKAYEFFWRGQFAGFIVKGRFVFDGRKEYDGGIVREDDLFDLTVSFYDPQGIHLRTYKRNQKKKFVNFAFSTLSEELLTDGTWNVDDNDLFYRNGFMMGEGNPALKGENGKQSGLAFWSRPGDDKTPHLHVDDWNDDNGDGEFGFPIGYSTHEDASFSYKTTQSTIDGGKVGSAYYVEGELNKLASDINGFGQNVRVKGVRSTKKDKKGCGK